MTTNRRDMPPAQGHPVLAELVAEMDRAWTQEELAERYGGTPATLSRLRRGGACNATFNTITWIAEALGYRLTLERIPGAPERPTKPERMGERREAIVAAWNAKPYRTMAEVAKALGVPRDVVAGAVFRARRAGLVTRPKHTPAGYPSPKNP